MWGVEAARGSTWDPWDEGAQEGDCSAVAADVAVVVAVVDDIAAVEHVVDEDCGKIVAGDTGTDMDVGVHHYFPYAEDSLHC